MHNYWFWYYFGLINLISGVIFISDKIAAIKNQHRIPERTLHFFEILGGVLANIVLMYILRHKNRKFSYYFWTWTILIGWIIFINLLLKNL